jgi:hypothetical protein
MRRVFSALMAMSLFAIIVPLDVALAQATRTFVSGVGDDVNPCSRTAPCKTFSGAMAKTADGGEVDTLDPGFVDVGPVVIYKSITIDGGSILVSADVGVAVIAEPTSRIILRNLTINGAGTELGLIGIQFSDGNSLLVENVKIMNFTWDCLSFNTVTRANLLVSNSSMSNCGRGAITSSTIPGSSNFVQINSSTFFKSAAPIVSGVNTTMEISNSVITANGGGGVVANDATSVLNIQNSNILDNTNFGVQSRNGAVVRLSQTNVTNNAGPGLESLVGGQIVSFRNNYIAGNSPDGAPTSTIPPQ